MIGSDKKLVLTHCKISFMRHEEMVLFEEEYKKAIKEVTIKI